MNDYVMEQENMEIAAEETAQRHRARQPGTQEHRILQEINTNTQQLDRDNPLPSGRSRMPRRPEWEFKIERATRDRNTQGGIDWWRYREDVLKPKLYPWADSIARQTGQVVYIVEDNASPHAKAKRFSEQERR